MPTRIKNVNNLKVTVNTGDCTCPTKTKPKGPGGNRKSLAPKPMKTRSFEAVGAASSHRSDRRYMTSNGLGGQTLVNGGLAVTLDGNRHVDPHANEYISQAFHDRLVAAQRTENERAVSDIRNAGSEMVDSIAQHADDIGDTLDRITEHTKPQTHRSSPPPPGRRPQPSVAYRSNNTTTPFGVHVGGSGSVRKKLVYTPRIHCTEPGCSKTFKNQDTLNNHLDKFH
jgi:hypothetical protein